MVHPTTDHQTHLHPEVLKTGETSRNTTGRKYLRLCWSFLCLTSFSTRVESTSTSSVHGPCVAQQRNAEVHWKTGYDSSVSIYNYKNCAVEESWVVVDQSGHKVAISKRMLMGKVQKRPWTSSTEPSTRFDRPSNVVSTGPWTIVNRPGTEEKTAWKRGKNWLRQIMTWNFNILIGLNDPFLPVKACLCRFQPFLARKGPVSTRTGCRSTRTASKNLEEWDKTCQHSVPCLSTAFDRSVLSKNISAHFPQIIYNVKVLYNNPQTPFRALAPCRGCASQTALDTDTQQCSCSSSARLKPFLTSDERQHARDALVTTVQTVK